MREAGCVCGQLKVNCEGEPSRVTICHCVECQKRTGSVMHVGARFESGQIEIIGVSKAHERISDAGEDVGGGHRFFLSFLSIIDVPWVKRSECLLKLEH